MQLNSESSFDIQGFLKMFPIRGLSSALGDDELQIYRGLRFAEGEITTAR